MNINISYKLKQEGASHTKFKFNNYIYILTIILLPLFNLLTRQVNLTNQDFAKLHSSENLCLYSKRLGQTPPTKTRNFPQILQRPPTCKT